MYYYTGKKKVKKKWEKWEVYYIGRLIGFLGFLVIVENRDPFRGFLARSQPEGYLEFLGFLVDCKIYFVC